MASSGMSDRTPQDSPPLAQDTPETATPLISFQNTISQLWQRVRNADVAAPEHNDSPVIILGSAYKGDIDSTDIARAIHSILWFTYRAGFEPIPRAEDGPAPLSFVGSMLAHTGNHMLISDFFNNKSFCTDVGWGCMIRTSQSLLANALQRAALHALKKEATNLEETALHEDILALFKDNFDAPFSIHNFIRVASELPLAVKPGQWFGPSAASLSIMRLCNNANSNHVSSPKLKVLISENSDLRDEDVQEALCDDSAPLLILLPVRLGIENINALYYPSLLQLLSVRQAMGIAGGKPSSSFYFFGYSGSLLLYLDPHKVQAASGEMGTYKTLRCLVLPLSELDPSMVIGCLIEDWSDYQDFKLKLAGSNKIVHFHERVFRQKRSVSIAKRGQSEPRTEEDSFIDLGEEFVEDPEPDARVMSLYDGFDEDATDKKDEETDTRSSRADSILGKCEMVDGPPPVTVIDD